MTNASTKRLNKVPAVTASFWVIKIMSTTVGETGADYLAVHVGLGTAVTGGIMGEAAAGSASAAIASRYLHPLEILVDGGPCQTLGVIVFGTLIAFIACAYYLGANVVLTFWLAYILTRPLGASLGDLLSQSQANGGAELSTIVTSVVFLAVISILVVGLSISQYRPVSARSVDNS